MFTKHHSGNDLMLRILRPAIALTLGLACLSLGQSLAVAQPAEGERSSGPTTYLELYLETYECGLYFAYMAEGLGRSGAPEDSIEFYADKTSATPWALVAVGQLLSEAEQRRALKQGHKLEQRLKKKTGQGHGQLNAVIAGYDARCNQAFDNFEATAAAIRRRLERESGEPFADLKNQCVKVSTKLLTLTGKYDGVVGRSVKEVPTGGLGPIPSSKAGDWIKVRLAEGTVAEWNNVPIPPPPDAHVRLLESSEAEQARILGSVVQTRRSSYQDSCNRPSRPYLRGLDQGGTAYWAVTCLDGHSWCLTIDHEDRILIRYGCHWETGGGYPDCYSPCTRQNCYTTDVGVSSTLEYVPYTQSTTVERTPDERCAEITGMVMAQYRDSPPEGRGPHRVEIRTVERPACDEVPSANARISVEIAGTEDLDVLDIDIASLAAPGMALDLSAAPPCEVLHGNATADRYADLRCRFIEEDLAAPAARVPLTLSGSFLNRARFEGSFEACGP